MPSEPTCFCELFVGFSDVQLLSLCSQNDGSLVMRFEMLATIVGCQSCGSIAVSKGRSPVALIDLPCFGRPTRSIWLRHADACIDEDCGQATWTEADDEVAAVRFAATCTRSTTPSSYTAIVSSTLTQSGSQRSVRSGSTR